MVDHIEEEDLVDVIPGIGPIRAQQLDKAGVYTLGDLLSANLETLAEKTDLAESTLQRWINLAIFYKGGERTDVIEGISQATVEKLVEADVYTVDDLRSACPRELADQTDLHEDTLKMWVGDAVRRDDTRVTEIPKIGTERAKELAKIGILTVNDLTESDPDDVAKQTDIGRRFLQERIEYVRTNHS